ncbi:MAG: sensor histidine kinase [Anaerolineae bacterium]|nr:sensor histidine kinase [Anaerolineae bacterium]
MTGAESAVRSICAGGAGTLLLGVVWRNTATIDDYIAINRWDVLFVVPAYIALTWYVALYTGVKRRIVPWLVTLVLTTFGVVYYFRPNSVLGAVTAQQVTLPWGETITQYLAGDTIWTTLFLLSQLIVLGFIVVAWMLQFRRGDRRAALFLGLGVVWFVIMLTLELLGETGIIAYVPFGEIGFFGIAVAVTLQMADSILRTEESLDNYRTNLEMLVADRTSELEASQEKLLLEASVRAVTDERTRLARDLHDDVTQTIYSAALITEALPRIWERNPDEARRNLVKLRQLLRGALAEMRTMLFELRPASLESADLDILITQLADAFTGRTRIPVQLKLSGENKLPPDVKIACYRIAQETFNNIEKHARAEHVTLILNRQPDELMLTIQDDGVGFGEDAVSAENLGLTIMQERATGIGAELQIESEPASGTQVSLLWSAESEAEAIA